MNLSKEEQIKIFWNHGVLSWKLHDAQMKIYDQLEGIPNAEEVLLSCSRQFGKTYFCCVYAIEQALQNDNVIIAIIAPSKDQAKEIMVPKMLEIASDSPEGVIWQHKSSNKFLTKNNSQIIISGFDTCSESLRGKSIHQIIFEESGSFNIEQYDYRMRSVIKPTLTHSKARVKRIHATTPSPILHHHVNTSLIDKTKEAGTYFKYTIWDNPLLTEERVDEIIEDYGGEDSVDFRREYLCEIIEDLSLKIMPSFTMDNVVPLSKIRVDDQYKYQIVLDIGGVKDKTGILLGKLEYNTGIYEFVDEALLNNNVQTSEIVNTAMDILKEYDIGVNDVEWFADAPGQWLVDVRNNYGINIRLPAKEDKDTAIKALDLAFKKGTAVVSDKCRLLIKTCLEGLYNAKRTDFVRTAELGHADMIAAAYYAYRCRNQFWRPPVFKTSTIYTDGEGVTHYQGHQRRKKQEEMNNMKQLARAFGKGRR